MTPRPQPGNPKPRLFRLPAAEALINRFGFNSAGLDAFLDSLCRARDSGRLPDDLVIGVNLGKNASTPLAQAADDYLLGLERAAPHADYITINISSPNTADLRRLQGGDELGRLLAALDRRRARLVRAGHAPPLLLKIAPDLNEVQIEHLVSAVRRHSIDGVIATNTTIAREAVAHLPHGQEAGGLSGAPVAEKATRVLSTLRVALPRGTVLIGVGGVLDGNEARARRAAGADLVQLYTGLIYRGPLLVTEVARALADP